MLPPSDSLLHHAHKLSEAAANVEQNAVRPMPPPPYSTAAQRSDIYEDIENELAADEDRQAPIAIRVDASINVSGDGNSIILPRSAAESSLSHSSAASTASATAQRQRQTRLTDLTVSVLTALHQTGLLNAARTPTPVEIHIATGIKIEGNRNIICSGTEASRSLVGKRCLSGDGASRKRRSQSEPTEVPRSSKRPCTM